MPHGSTAHLGAKLHAETIRPTLREVVLGGLVDLGPRAAIAIHLEAGELRVDHPTGSRVSAAPCLLWMPFDRARRIRASAGSAGGYVIIGDSTLASAVGRRAESADLRLLASGTVSLGLASRPQVGLDVMQCFDMILREAVQGAAGAEAVIEVQLRILLILLWRHAALPAAGPPSRGGSGQILLRFRQAVETHFRDRWPVARYAADLGVSPDRLYDLCMRTLGKSPQRLVRERLNHEAQLLLERSSQTTDQIAGRLGFRSAAQFSAFFRIMNGMPPGAFRNAVRRRETPPPGYADWP